MSWQRIFDLARRQGIPMIVTDSMGLEPMIVLPLDQFEALTESGREPVAIREPASSPSVTSPSEEPHLESTPSLYAEAPAPTATPRGSQKELDDKKLLAELTPALSAEERFYLEPVEDSWSEPRV